MSFIELKVNDYLTTWGFHANSSTGKEIIYCLIDVIKELVLTLHKMGS